MEYNVDRSPALATKWPYSLDVCLDDIVPLHYALDLFLQSKMLESEQFCHQNDPEK